MAARTRSQTQRRRLTFLRDGRPLPRPLRSAVVEEEAAVDAGAVADNEAHPLWLLRRRNPASLLRDRSTIRFMRSASPRTRVSPSRIGCESRAKETVSF